MLIDGNNAPKGHNIKTKIKITFFQIFYFLFFKNNTQIRRLKKNTRKNRILTGRNHSFNKQPTF